MVTTGSTLLVRPICARWEPSRTTNRPTAMRRPLICLVSLVALCACSGSDANSERDDRVPLSSEIGSAAGSVNTSVPAAPAASGASTSSAPTIATQPVVGIDSVVSICGPADGNWVEAVVVASDAVVVFARVSWSGQTYGRSESIALAPGERTSIGFDPERPAEAFGQIAELEVVREDTSSVLGSHEVLLKLPDGVGCG